MIWDAPQLVRLRAAAEAAAAPDELTEHGVALEFALQQEAQLRYCHHAGAWYVWTGSRWQRNETRLAFAWSRALIARLNRDSPSRTKVVTGKAAFAAAVRAVRASGRSLAVTSATWDRDPWLLGTPGGTVDLKTGELERARQTDHITKQTAVAPAEWAMCPEWEAFLNQDRRPRLRLCAAQPLRVDPILIGGVAALAILLGFVFEETDHQSWHHQVGVRV